MPDNPITDNHMPKRFSEIINEELKIFGREVSITERNKIPETNEIPIQEPSSHWFKIKSVICVVVDTE
ncbi:MAG TPA: hypothetical protein VE954_16245 [Oligoflexus sp.]|uniref:hypothetical protein n=1 Tax=Oligoflexus sp. TaxID=1971216 RepID=UPI002D4DD136|nr:hypothetical protein [Oligoflexus sp.]HYX34651.1 hypothetical protein [Oligoflexus sp.]